MSKRVVVVVFALAIAALAGIAVGCGGDLPGDAVAKVGEGYITEEDFNLRLSEVATQYGVTEESDPEYYGVLKQQVLAIMVENSIAAIKAQEIGLTVTAEEVQTEIDTMLAMYYGGDQALLEEDLSAANITFEQFKAEYEEYLLSGKVYDEITKDITEVPEAEIVANYEENKDSYFTPESRTVRHILVMPGADITEDTGTTSTTVAGGTTTTTILTDADWQQALATANEVRDKLVAGGDWAELAAEYSDDTYTQGSGGDLGAIGKGEMVAEFEAAVFSQDAYEISQPVKTIYGYHVIQVTQITDASQKTLDEVRETIKASLVDQAKFEAWTAWVEEMKTKVGVIYREDLAPTTTTVAPVDGATTTVPGETTTTSAGQTITTAAPATTTTE